MSDFKIYNSLTQTFLKKEVLEQIDNLSDLKICVKQIDEIYNDIDLFIKINNKYNNLLNDNKQMECFMSSLDSLKNSYLKTKNHIICQIEDKEQKYIHDKKIYYETYEPLLQYINNVESLKKLKIEAENLSFKEANKRIKELDDEIKNELTKFQNSCEHKYLGEEHSRREWYTREKDCLVCEKQGAKFIRTVMY
jgi:hypothetical protein